MGDYFKDYPAIERGLAKLKVTELTDLQLQLLDVSENMDNLVLTAQETAGKTVGLILHALRKFSNEEEGILVVLAHSKELSQHIHHFLSACIQSNVVNLYMQDIGELGPKTVLVGSPLQVNHLWKKDKDRIIAITIPEADVLFGFGYGESLELLAGSLIAKKVVYKLSCVDRGTEIEKFKTEWMKKAHRIDYELPEAIKEKSTEKEEQITHFYGVGDRMNIPVSLYVALKFGLMNPKILVVVENLREVYRYALFLERCRIPAVGVYNNEDPVNLKFYNLSTWMNGTTGVMIATPQLFEDIDGPVFRKHARKHFKRERFQLVNMTSMIILGLHYLEDSFEKLLEAFQNKPFIMTFTENKEAEIAKLQELISFEKERFEHAIVKELPITRRELEGFRYRINDAWTGLTNHRADLFRQLDFKKKLLKTPELKDQFASNGKEREVLVKAINDLRKKIDHGKVNISEYIPDYLVPECLRSSYQEKMNLMQAKIDEEAPISHQKVKKVLRYVNLEDENP